MNTPFIKMLIPIVMVVLSLTWFCIRTANSHVSVQKNATKTWSELIVKCKPVELTVKREKIEAHSEKTMIITSEIDALDKNIIFLFFSCPVERNGFVRNSSTNETSCSS
jgi:hypothetical protein